MIFLSANHAYYSKQLYIHFYSLVFMKNGFWCLKDLSVSGKTVLLRVDFNVPLDGAGKISNDSRIRAVLPSINYLVKKNAKIVLMSHLGKPNGFDEKLRMDVVAERLEKLLGRSVIKLDDCVGAGIKTVVEGMHGRDVVLLENLRFHAEEELNSKKFAESLSDLGDVYVDDAFGCMHRSHASIDAITNFLPSCAGFLVEREIKMLKLLERPKRPFVAIMGGAKISDKIRLMKKLLDKVDVLLVGGAMMFTFLKSKKFEVGKSLVENDLLDFAKGLLKNKKVILPVDVVGDYRIDDGSNAKLVLVDAIPKNFVGADIGPESIDVFCQVLKSAKTVFWNGPLGLCERAVFRKGTEDVAGFIAKLRITKIVGGGDSGAVIEKLGLGGKFTHVSTGGGASLEFLEAGTLPGIVALERSFSKFLKYKKKGGV